MERTPGRRPTARSTRKIHHVEELTSISKESLSNINNEKSMIAEMRPRRRRIKWNSAVSDWDRKTANTTTTRIKVGIDLEELGLLGGVPLQPTQEEKNNAREVGERELSFINGDQVDELEIHINRTYDAIKDVTGENDDLDVEVEQLMEQNQALRQEIAGMPMGKKLTRKGLDQLLSMEVRLNKKVREMERQCKLLKRRQREIKEAKKRLKDDDGFDETRSYATHTSKSISTFVETEDDSDEDIQVFTTGKPRQSESEGDYESYGEDSASLEEVEEQEEQEEEEETEADEINSLGSLEGEKEMAPEPSLGDSLSNLPYDPSIVDL